MGLHARDGTYNAYRSVINLSLNDFREATSGDVGNIVANGGILASDTTPVLSGTGTTVSQQLLWAAANVDQILCQMALPEDFSGKDDVIVELWVNSGTTDPATFSCLTNWDAAAADITDTITDGAKSATTHKISGVIAAADVPDNASFLSLALVPATHGTNAMVLVAARLLYLPKRVS